MPKLSDNVYEEGLSESIKMMEYQHHQLWEDYRDFLRLMKNTASYGVWLTDHAMGDNADVLVFIVMVFDNIHNHAESAFVKLGKDWAKASEVNPFDVNFTVPPTDK